MIAARRISVLGATGSVGLATLDLIERAEPGRFEVVALTANRNAAALASLAIQHRARFVAIGDPAAAQDLREALSSHPEIEIGIGADAIVEAARRPADWTMAAIVGAAGLKPTLAALRQGRALAFANKECLVCAGALFMREAAACGTRLLPVDSEHNAVFQVFDFERPEAIRAITLTASGGPFRTWSLDRMRSARREDALAHPTWEMGAKITIDSATMMNKGLEIIEACWLFDLTPDRVEVVVHPQSIVHGMVEYEDGSVLAQLGSPDMRTPIASALAWPQRMRAPVERLRLSDIARLDFETPDDVRFPALRLARAVIAAGGPAPAVFNAANEIAVAGFLKGRIGFLDIAASVEEVLERSLVDAGMPKTVGSFDDVYAIDARSRELARDLIDTSATLRARTP
ncbi:1-deoxy-D-xylulose-5-phosphate reductoisomerase [Maricaulis salignorans]|uniref:1-deoxy-D-xylulose 5-phosphate reductoisomerase n=1 Tax=Maricaulis salignorans TaxID=144026 RepID=A0A1G9V9Z1_9PROT|nr:1-deoxy-D-xylulose-5-phosphate reductoisomerase [Maricaulis salignorans]SDM68900.1 1-deoxy-D-xylulose 5-phosphate reductoisomerase [Maricaulis salignorans]